MRPSFWHLHFHNSYYIFTVSLFLQYSQVRTQGLNNDISILTGTEYNNLNQCLRACLYDDVDDNGLVQALDCGLPIPNACYCNADKLQIATNAISSCITADCTNVDNLDISTAIKVYTDYCITASAADVVVTTDVASVAIASASARATPTQTTASPTDTSSGGNSNCEIVNSTGNNSCDNNSHNSQTSGANSSSGLGKGLSLSDKIAIGVGLGVGIPSIVVAFLTYLEARNG